MSTPTMTLDHQAMQALRGAGRDSEGEPEFGWCLQRPVDGSAHLLVTCHPGAMWRTMPGQAVRTATSQHLNRYAATLTKAGFGIVAWGRGWTELLIVAADQATADEQAAIMLPRIAALNPEGDHV